MLHIEVAEAALHAGLEEDIDYKALCKKERAESERLRGLVQTKQDELDEEIEATEHRDRRIDALQKKLLHFKGKLDSLRKGLRKLASVCRT